MANPGSVCLKLPSLDLPACFREDSSWLAEMEGLEELQAGSLARLQLEIPSQGQRQRGSEQTVELGAGVGWRSQASRWESRRLCSASSPLCLCAQAHCGLRGQSILLGGGNCWPLESKGKLGLK